MLYCPLSLPFVCSKICSMPGTIKVSVLDLMDIPSSASSSLVSVKVAMGKREFQTCDKGDFLFPLTTVRDNLIVTLCDAEGNEISRTDVATMSVVQKGLWDDVFPLEGGGLIHMRLQFILSEEDRKRIQDMREAAVKKKQGELGKRSVNHSETPRDVAAGDLQETAVPMKAIGVSEEPIKGSNLEPIKHIEDLQSSSDVQEHQPEQTAPDGGGNPSTDPLSQAVHKDSEHPSECVSSRPTEANYSTSEETQSSNTKSTSPDDVIQKPIWSHEALDPSLRCSVSSPAEFITENKNSVSSTSGEDRTHGSQTESSTKRNPSSVRKMISAFETTLTQGPRSQVGPLEKPQRSKIKMESSSKRPWVEEASTISISTGRLPDANLQQNPKYFESLHAKKLEETPHSNPDTGRKDPFGLKNEQLELLEVQHDPVEETNSDKDGRESNRCLGIEDGGWKTWREDSDDLLVSGASKGKQELVIDNEVRRCLFESPWSWIFQDETRHLCITTGSKQMRNVVEGYDIYAETQKQPGVVNFPKTEEESKICEKTHTEVNKDDATSCNLRKPKLDNSADISKIAWGLIEQAIKVGILVVCGAILFSTRERKTR